MWEYFPTKWGNLFPPARESLPTIYGTKGVCDESKKKVHTSIYLMAVPV